MSTRASTAPAPRAPWFATLVLALLAGLAMAAVPFAPVTQHTATYRWDSHDAVALPLSPYRPERLRLSVDCTKLGTAQGHLLTTGRAIDPDLTAHRLDLSVRGTDLEVRSGGHTMLWPGAAVCTRLDLDVAPEATRLWSLGAPLQTFPGDHRPTVDGFSPPPIELAPDDENPPGSWVATRPRAVPLDAFTAEVVADTQWDTSPTPLKLALMALAVALLAAALTCAIAADRRTRTTTRPTAIHAPRPRPTLDDAALAALIATGVLIGGANDDDGFISQIIRTRTMSGYLGNYARWANAPEAPFGWFYEPLSRWGAVSMEPVWLRLLPAVVALVGWVVLRHGLFPRLVPEPSRASRVVLVVAYAGCWLVFGNSLRPEVWYATGLGIVCLCVLVALERRAVWPLFAGALVSGLSVGTNPTGVVALAPFVLAARPLGRWLQTLPLRGLPVIAAGLACVGAIVPIAFADQSLAAVVSAAHARARFGPIFPWWQDSRRYWMLWQSLAARQVAVFVPAVAMVALGWFWWRTRGADTTAPDGVRRSLAGLVAACAPALALAMLFGPTKLPHHFGGLMLVGPLAMAAAAELLVRETEDSWSRRRWLDERGLVLGGSLIALGAALHGNNVWWKLSSLGMVADRRPLALGNVPAWALVVLAGVAVTVALAVIRRPLRHAATAYAVVLALVLGGQLANFAQAAARRGPDRYTPGSGALAALTGDGCRLERSLHVESGSRAQSVLPAPEGPNPFRPGSDPDAVAAWEPNGAETMTTGWYALPARVTAQRWPVVIEATGLDAAHRVRVEFDHGTARELPVPRQTEVVRPLHTDIPVTPPAGATRLRVVASADRHATDEATAGRRRTFRVGQPRVPQTEPLLDLARRSSVAIAWNLAFFAPCLHTPRHAHGAVELPSHLLSDSARPGNMSYTARDGGPFAAARGLTTAERVPLYSAGDNTEPTITSLELVRLEPSRGGRVAVPELGTRVRRGWDRLPRVP